MDDAIKTSAWQQPNTFMDIISPKANSLSPRAVPKKSSTLMRTAVKKPAIKVTVDPVPQASSPIETSRPDLSAAATLTDQSPLISRFSSNNDFAPQATVPISIEPAPEERLNFPSMDGPETQEATSSPATLDSQPLAAEAAAIALPQTGFDIFKNSLPSQIVDNPAKTLKPRNWNVIKRWSGWSVLAIAVIGIVGGGIFINQNFAKLELYLASSKAGFSATLPSIKPSGYDLSSVSTGSGVVQASFKSNSDSRTYTISEKKSTLSSSALLDSYVDSQAGLNYQSIQTEGRTIYVYNGHDATWVNNGVWYVINDNNSLSDHQIIDIADSM